MKIYKTKWFKNWSATEKVGTKSLINVILEMEQGLKGSNLGGQLYKKRVAAQGRGKSAGKRLIVAYVQNNRSFFVYGFSKNEAENITKKQESALKEVAKKLISYTNKEIQHAIKEGILFEVINNEVN